MELPEEEDDEVDEFASLAFSDEFSASSDPPSPMSVFSLKSPPARQSSKLGQVRVSFALHLLTVDFFFSCFSMGGGCVSFALHLLTVDFSFLVFPWVEVY